MGAGKLKARISFSRSLSPPHRHHHRQQLFSGILPCSLNNQSIEAASPFRRRFVRQTSFTSSVKQNNHRVHLHDKCGRMRRSSTLLRIIALAFVLAVLYPIFFFATHDVSTLIRDGNVVVPQKVVKVMTSSTKPSKPKTSVLTNNNPRLILHVGLPKTATSTIQCSLSAMEKKGRYE